MHTVEATYALAISLFVMIALVNSSINYHQELYSFTSVHMEKELESHRENGTKELFQPETFLRGATLLEGLLDSADKSED